MVIEALVALGVITIATVNAPVENKAPQEIKSVSTTIDAKQEPDKVASIVIVGHLLSLFVLPFVLWLAL